MSLASAKLEHSNGYALSAELATVGGTLFASNSFECKGGLDLEGIKVAGKAVLSGAVIKGHNRRALDLDHAEIRLGLHADDIKTDGRFQIHHARIGCQLGLARAELHNSRGKALRADHIIVDGSVLLNDTAKVFGQIDLHGAQIECTLNLYGLEVSLEG